MPGTLSARAVTLKAQRLINDLTGVRWGFDELVDWLNEGQRAITLLRPDASSAISTLALIAGTKQAVPTNSWRLLDVARNLNVDGSAGRAPRYVERSELDAANPNWHAVTASAIVRHWMVDGRLPKVFWVYPPQPTSDMGRLEIVTSVPPADCTLADVNNQTSDSVISLEDVYEASLVDYMVYRSYSKDANYTARGGKADLAYTRFMQSLGQQAKTDREFDAKASVPPHANPNAPGNVGPL